MSLRRSTRLRKVTEESNVTSDSESESISSNNSSPKHKSKSRKSLHSKTSKRRSHSPQKQSIHMIQEPLDEQPTVDTYAPKQKSKRAAKSVAKSVAKKAVSDRNSSSSEKILTPPTPEITSKMLEKKPWLSKEFLDSVLEELKSPSTVSKETPKMLSLVGPMAAGKSTVKHQLHFDDAVNLDVDEVKIIATREFGQRAKGIFADFSKIIQLLGVMIIDKKYDFILDTTGKMKEQIKYVMKKAKSENYTIDIAIVYSTKELCETRASHRNVTYTERDPVPIFVVGKVYDEFKDSKRAKSYIIGIKDIVDMTDNLYLFDNSRCTPEAALIMEKHGQTINVYEDFPDFYGVSISQLSPKIVAKGIKKTKKHYKKRQSHRKTRRH
jgi:predicted kinase